jgi:hypothetical protein
VECIISCLHLESRRTVLSARSPPLGQCPPTASLIGAQTTARQGCDTVAWAKTYAVQSDVIKAPSSLQITRTGKVAYVRAVRMCMYERVNSTQASVTCSLTLFTQRSIGHQNMLRSWYRDLCCNYPQEGSGSANSLASHRVAHRQPPFPACLQESGRLEAASFHGYVSWRCRANLVAA